jgi:structural maintenance of chromosome 2
MNEFVYKKGQAGISKASVTLVFNNEDPSTSPVGYEQMKKLFIRRQVGNHLELSITVLIERRL